MYYIFTKTGSPKPQTYPTKIDVASHFIKSPGLCDQNRKQEAQSPLRLVLLLTLGFAANIVRTEKLMKLNKS